MSTVVLYVGGSAARLARNLVSIADQAGALTELIEAAQQAQKERERFTQEARPALLAAEELGNDDDELRFPADR